jgi:hypothetical protein
MKQNVYVLPRCCNFLYKIQRNWIPPAFYYQLLKMKLTLFSHKPTFTVKYSHQHNKAYSYYIMQVNQ